jgi:hypothetical protein
MNDDCRDRRGDLAAFALDRLDHDERTRVLAHVDGCPTCQGALVELQVAARALPFASIEHLEVDDAPSNDLAERIARSARAERRRERGRRTRRVLVGAAGIAAALALAIGLFRMVRDDSTPALQPFATAPSGTAAQFALERNDQGTQIVFRQSGLDPDRIYWMWLADASGQRYGAGTFRGTAQNQTITFQSALPLEQTVRVWCTDVETDIVLDSWVTR